LSASGVEPIVRCTECQKVTLTADLHNLGECSKCGCKRMRNIGKVLELTDDEWAYLKDKVPDGYWQKNWCQEVPS